MKQCIDGVVSDMTPEEEGAFLASLPGPVPERIQTKLYKSTFIRRLTASEATDLEGVLNSEEAYIRLLYQSVEWFDVSDALVMYLFMTLEMAYGNERATALLTPEA